MERAPCVPLCCHLQHVTIRHVPCDDVLFLWKHNDLFQFSYYGVFVQSTDGVNNNRIFKHNMRIACMVHLKIHASHSSSPLWDFLGNSVSFCCKINKAVNVFQTWRMVLSASCVGGQKLIACFCCRMLCCSVWQRSDLVTCCFKHYYSLVD